MYYCVLTVLFHSTTPFYHNPPINKYLAPEDEEDEDETDDAFTGATPPGLGPVDFPSTTTYHWGEFNVNATTGVSEGYETVQGPLQFQNAVELDSTRDQVNSSPLQCSKY